jgi:hypothetical protein
MPPFILWCGQCWIRAGHMCYWHFFIWSIGMEIVKLWVPISTPYKNISIKIRWEVTSGRHTCQLMGFSTYHLYQVRKEFTLNFAACARSGLQAFISRVDIDGARSWDLMNMLTDRTEGYDRILGIHQEISTLKALGTWRTTLPTWTTLQLTVK